MGLYPSMFSANSFSGRYWETPVLYERDRPLFKRYIPLIRRLNTAGWQPITYATSSDASVYVERYGSGPNPTLCPAQHGGFTSQYHTYSRRRSIRTPRRRA